MVEQLWVSEARKLIGQAEVKGPQHNPEILQMWREIRRGGIRDDETPWCAAFVGAMLERAGIRSSRFESARSYLDWGQHLTLPVPGCIVVFTRQGGGHVGFAVGRDQSGKRPCKLRPRRPCVTLRAPCGMPALPAPTGA